MKTQTFDLLTLLHAMHRLAEDLGDNAHWLGMSDDQDEVVHLLAKYAPAFSDYGDLKSLVSRYYQELNRFLQDNGFEPVITHFDPATGIGVVSMIDILVQWTTTGIPLTIDTPVGEKPGFELTGFEVFVASDGLLVRMDTTGAYDFWAYMPSPDTADVVPEGLDLFIFALEVMSLKSHESGSRPGETSFDKLHFPCLSVSTDVELDWLLGLAVETDSDFYEVTQAGQQFKLAVNKRGAHMKVETHLVAKRSIMPDVVLEFDQPFYGWFTRKDASVKLPVGIFYADFDSWGEPDTL